MEIAMRYYLILTYLMINAFNLLMADESALATFQELYATEVARIERQRDSKLRELQNEYIEGLRGLKAGLTSSGDIDGALAVADEIESISANGAQAHITTEHHRLLVAQQWAKSRVANIKQEVDAELSVLNNRFRNEANRRAGESLAKGDITAGREWREFARSLPDNEVPRQTIEGPVEGRDWTSPTTGMQFVWIPAMRLWVGKFEVTNCEYRRFVPEHDSGEFQGHSLNGDRQPVVMVNFDDAKAYAAWMTDRDRATERLPEGFRYRLPTEQEWETFATVGNNWEFPWGNNWPPVSGQAGNYGDDISGFDDGHVVSSPVEKSWANPWGLFGVGGNVWELTARDTSNASFGALRGGSWGDSRQEILRVSYRRGRGSTRNSHRGFRLVLSR
jgi:formylglycine-generating enzyme required for sulfatase activity